MRLSGVVRVLSVVPLAVGVLLSGCEGLQVIVRADTGETDRVVRDSADVRIVESAAPAWRSGEVWTVDATPALWIGSGEGELALSNVADAKRLPDGRVVTVVTEGASIELQVFDTTGVRLARFGGGGEGPGEFHSVPGIFAGFGYEILAVDPQAFRVTWFTPDGQVLRTEPLPPELGATHFRTGVSRTESLVVFEDGSVLHAGAVSPLVTDEWVTFDLRLDFVSPGRSEGITLGQFPDSQRAIVPSGGAQGTNDLFLTNPYFPPALYAAGPESGRFHIGSTGDREIRTFGSDGRLERIVRQRIPLTPLSQEAIDRHRTSVHEAAVKADVDPDVALDFVDRLAIPDSVFPFRELNVDLEGNLWAEVHVLDPEAPQRTFHVFDRMGGWLGTVNAPGDLGDITEIGRDYILAVQPDALGESQLGLYRIRR